MMKQENILYTLFPLEDFKALMGVDDREDKIARFCLVTATYSIEQYCRRRLLLKKHQDVIPFTNVIHLDLNQYPVRKILSVHGMYHLGHPDLIEPEMYTLVPDEQALEDVPYTVVLSPITKCLMSIAAVRVKYRAGYSPGNVPLDLAAACMELAAWNMNRYRGRRIGMTGNIRGNGKDGEHFELSMPMQVRELLDPYRRKVI